MSRHEAENRRITEASGSVESTSPLVDLLYHLARDHLPVGVLEKAVRDATTLPRESRYCNGWLARWAGDAADRLTGTSTVVVAAEEIAADLALALSQAFPDKAAEPAEYWEEFLLSLHFRKRDDLWAKELFVYGGSAASVVISLHDQAPFRAYLLLRGPTGAERVPLETPKTRADVLAMLEIGGVKRDPPK